MSDDKAQRIAEAAKNRTQAERELAKVEGTDKPKAKPTVEEELAQMDAMIAAGKIKPQALAGTMEGEIDLAARGDVKGDGGDAKNYADSDPDKYLSPTTAEYGLNEDRATGVSVTTIAARSGQVISERTRQEMDRGAQVVKGRTSGRRAIGKTVVTEG